jgi:alpha-tubulin suppressor-like RCC1 family protein
MSTAHVLAWSLGAALLAGCGAEPAQPVVAAQVKVPPVITTVTTTEVSCVEGNADACGAGQVCVAGSCRPGRSIAARGASACVVTSGKVACWGDNSGGALAAGSRGPRSTPVVVAGIEDATKVRVGSRFGCAVTAAGKVACFREGNGHELSGIGDVADIAIQDDVLLVVHKNGELAGVSLGSSGNELRPVEVPKLTDVVQIAAHGEKACVVHRKGEVMCWGPEYSFSAPTGVAEVPVQPKGLKDVAQISVGPTHTCAVLKSKRVMCWGMNWTGQLGDGTSDVQSAPVAVQLLDDAVEVATGHQHTCARRVSGKVVCWGEGRSGQLGAGGSVRGLVEVRDVTDAVALAAGDDASCAARASGGVSCWGSASRGRLGNGATSEFPSPQPVKGVASVTQLALGDRLSCAVDGQKQLQCWGFPGYVSAEDEHQRAYAPVPLAGLGEVASAWSTDISLCVINKEDSVFCDYASSFARGNKLKPLGLKDLKARKFIESEQSSGVGVAPSGQVFLWRDGDPPQKTNVPGLPDAVSVVTSGSVVCAARRAGKVGCVGYGFRSYEQSEPIRATSVVEVPDIKDAVHLVVDDGGACVLRKTGAVACFSTSRVPRPFDPEAEKKKNAEAKREKPRPIEVRPVKGVTDVTSLAAGGGARCGIKRDATLVCWGANGHGQLGTGDFAFVEEPAPVPGLTDVAMVALGGGQTCVARKSGDVLCWGDNSQGQAGQPAPPLARSPVPVLLP